MRQEKRILQALSSAPLHATSCGSHVGRGSICPPQPAPTQSTPSPEVTVLTVHNPGRADTTRCCGETEPSFQQRGCVAPCPHAGGSMTLDIEGQTRPSQSHSGLRAPSPPLPPQGGTSQGREGADGRAVLRAWADPKGHAQLNAAAPAAVSLKTQHADPVFRLTAAQCGEDKCERQKRTSKQAALCPAPRRRGQSSRTRPRLPTSLDPCFAAVSRNRVSRWRGHGEDVVSEA